MKDYSYRIKIVVLFSILSVLSVLLVSGIPYAKFGKIGVIVVYALLGIVGMYMSWLITSVVFILNKGLLYVWNLVIACLFISGCVSMLLFNSNIWRCCVAEAVRYLQNNISIG